MASAATSMSVIANVLSRSKVRVVGSPSWTPKKSKLSGANRWKSCVRVTVTVHGGARSGLSHGGVWAVGSTGYVHVPPLDIVMQ